jgi:hypothetical protein
MYRHLLAALALVAHSAGAEEPQFTFRELQACPKGDETVWRAAKLRTTKAKAQTVIEVDALFNCATRPKNPSVHYSPVSTTLSVEEAGVFSAMCLCRHVMQFTVPRELERGTTVYFAIEGKVYGHAQVR